MREKKDITVAFTGHRVYDGEADDRLRSLLQELYERGYRRFMTGMAWGFDLAAGRAVMALKRLYGDVELVAVVPYEAFSALFHDAALAEYDDVMAAADEVLYISERGGNAAFRRRNDFLVDNASLVVAWWNHLPTGGTAYTVKRAAKQGCEIINLSPPAENDLFTMLEI